MTDPPETSLPARWMVLRARGPFTLDGERQLFAEHRFRCVVTRTRGVDTAAKLVVAAETGAMVVMLRRPAPPAGVETVSTVDAALAWLAHRPA